MHLVRTHQNRKKETDNSTKQIIAKVSRGELPLSALPQHLQGPARNLSMAALALGATHAAPWMHGAFAVGASYA